MYYIKEILIYTTGNRVSKLDFKLGLNIIHGKSNTGKSLIVDCIDYLYGSKEPRFDKNLNIKKISLILDVEGKQITLTRAINSNFIDVISNVSYIETDKYSANVSAKKPISKLWLRLMGIDDDVKIIKTLEGKIQQLTFRTFSHIFLINEDRSISTNTILSSKNPGYGKVATNTLSSLIYLLNGNNYIPDDDILDKKTIKLRKEAVKDFVDRSMMKISDYQVSTLAPASNDSPEQLQNSIESIINDIDLEEGILEESSELSLRLSRKIENLEKEINNLNILYERNNKLASQYAADIQRLAFIVEGDINNEELSDLCKCPFCNGELTNNHKESCIDAAIEEVEKINSQVVDLNSTQLNLESKINDYKSERDHLIKERNTVNYDIRRKIKPQIKELRAKLTNYEMALNNNKAKEMIKEFNDVLLSELAETEKEDALKEIHIPIKEKFIEFFRRDLEKELSVLLDACNYKNYNFSNFDTTDYDVIVNGHKKSSQGKGYRAYLNTIFAIVILNCLEKNALYIPKILVVDSPILSLKEVEDESSNEELLTDTMKAGLFNYLVNNEYKRQTIIIENDIPKIDYKDAKLIPFSKNDSNDERYGLIVDYKE